MNLSPRRRREKTAPPAPRVPVVAHLDSLMFDGAPVNWVDLTGLPNSLGLVPASDGTKWGRLCLGTSADALVTWETASAEALDELIAAAMALRDALVYGGFRHAPKGSFTGWTP